MSIFPVMITSFSIFSAFPAKFLRIQLHSLWNTQLLKFVKWPRGDMFVQDVCKNNEEWEQKRRFTVLRNTGRGKKMKFCNSVDIATILGLPFSSILHVDHIKITSRSYWRYIHSLFPFQNRLHDESWSNALDELFNKDTIAPFWF